MDNLKTLSDQVISEATTPETVPTQEGASNTSDSPAFCEWANAYYRCAQAFAAAQSYDRMYHFTFVDGKQLEHARVIRGMIHYYLGETEQAAQYGLDTRKGIRISGNTGSGKTMIFQIMQAIKICSFNIKAALDIVEEFNAKGEAIVRYGAKGVELVGTTVKLNRLMIDDLGKESRGGHYSKKNRNVIGEILDYRYDLWVRYGLRTDMTDNLTNDEIESPEYYGDRIGGRIFQMTNHIFVGADQDSVDFRRMGMKPVPVQEKLF